jgi:two-component system LytT family response regulator
MRVVIVDDEELARRILREHLSQHRDVSIVGECANGFEAVKSVAELKPDLVFLDIQMPKLSGFEVLELLDPVPAIIFVTAFDSYALKAFEVHAVDYLLKPFSADRFDEAVNRAKTRIDGRERTDISGLVADHRHAAVPLERILIRDGTKVHVIAVDTIDYIEAKDDYVSIHAGGRSHLKQEPLASFESSLDSRRFVRIHRSIILNVARLARLESYAKDSRLAILGDGTRLHVSRTGYEKLKAMM